MVDLMVPMGEEESVERSWWKVPGRDEEEEGDTIEGVSLTILFESLGKKGRGEKSR